MLAELILPVLAMTAEDVAGDYLHHYAAMDPWTGRTVFGPTMPGSSEVAHTLALLQALSEGQGVSRLGNRSPWTSLFSGGVVTRTAVHLASGGLVAVVVKGWQADLARRLADHIEAAMPQPSPYFSRVDLSGFGVPGIPSGGFAL